ncbi:MAG: radical SAM protein [Magnetococcales bacterium]|nr:radical SAM protein [Magnetococcales bacterium]
MEYGFAAEKHRIFPPMLVVSIVNFCNLRCIHCYSPKFEQSEGYKRTEMSWEIWTKVCDEMAQFPWSILNLGTDGEPLLHSRFLDMMRYAKKKGIYPINITSNGQKLSKKISEPIIKERLLDVINISLDAFTEETYKKIRGGNMKRVLDNVHHLIELRNTHAPDIKIQVNIIDQPEAEKELEAFKAYWQPKVDNILVRPYYDATSVTGSVGGNITGKQKIASDVERWPCQLFWRRLTICEDGQFCFCIDDWHNKSEIGNINRTSIKDIWQGDTYETLRDHHINRRFSSVSYCSECTEWEGMRWDYDYFLAMEKMLGKNLLE